MSRIMGLYCGGIEITQWVIQYAVADRSGGPDVLSCSEQALQRGGKERTDTQGKTSGLGAGGGDQEHLDGNEMSTFADDLIQSLNEALAHARGEGPAILHTPVAPREVRESVKLTQAQMAPLMGMSLSGYCKWEQGARQVSGPAAILLRVIQREPDAVKRALLSSRQA